MSTLIRFAQILSIGLWTGAALFVGLLLAPGAFATLPTRELAGNVVAMALARLHLLGYVCGALYLTASAIAARSVSGLARPAAICVIAMLVLTVTVEFTVNAKLLGLRADMRAEFGSVDATPKEHALRTQFGRLHGVSSGVELLVLVLGACALFLTVRSSQ